MVAKSLGRSLAVLLLCPPAAFALGLGDIHLKSALNAPLDAEIDLVGATPEDLAGLRAQVAPQDAFARANLEWSKFLTTVNLRQVHTPDGRDVIQLHSSDAITEPFLTLLIQVTWARGQLLREYTVLLDPPVYTPGAQAPAVVAAPVTGASVRQGSVERNAAAAPAQGVASSTAVSQTSLAPTTALSPARLRAQGGRLPPAASAAAPALPAPAATVTGGTYTVRRGDTLSKLASQYGEVGQNRRWMVAAYQNNAAAFDGNINSLRSGAILRLPDAEAINAVSPSAAAAEVSRQYAAWREANGQGQPNSQTAGTPPARSATAPPAPANEPASASGNGRLKLVTPSERPSAGTAGSSQANAAAAASAAAATAAAEAKVRDLQAQLDESRRLLEMRNAELAQLQSRLGAQPSGPTPAAPPATTPSSAAQKPPASAPPAASAPATTESAPAAAPPPATATATPAAAPSTAPAEETGLVATLKQYWWALAIVLVAIAAALGLRSRRAREEAEFGDSLGRLAAAGTGSSLGASTATVETLRQPSGETLPLRQPALPEAENFLVEESGSHTRPTFDLSGAAEAAPVPPPSPPRNVTADQTISSDTAINLDQGDPLAEADFHMAYGLYDQAADLIRMAIAREPERRDLKLKLLEVFFVWGNKDQFLQTAHELASTRDNAAPGEWEKIVIMGKQLAPEDALFSGDQTMSSAAASSVDIDLDSGSRTGVDFDLLGEPIHEAAHGNGSVDLDIGGALGEPEPIRADAGEATDRNIALDSRLDINFDDPGADAAPTVEQPNFGAGDNPTIRQKVEMALRQGGGIDQTAELAIDDLGLDLGALDTVDQPGLGAGPDAPTLVAGLDDRSRRVIENAESRAQGQETVVVSSTSPTGPWQFSEDEGGEPTQQMPTPDESPTSRLAALKERDLDFDLDADSSAETGENATPPPTAGIDLDVGTPAIADSSYTETQQLGQDELALPNLEPVTMSEVGTKLDLARAYMDMGDPEGARNILDEVLQEGSATQKQEAQRLLESLPG